MSPISSVTLLINSLSLVMSLGFLVIILWHSPLKEVSHHFAFFVLAVAIWSVGNLAFLVSSFVLADDVVAQMSQRVLQMGFTVSTMSAYGLTAVLVQVRPPNFKAFLVLSILVVGILQLNFQPPMTNDTSSFSFSRSSVIVYCLFSATSVYLAWRYRDRLTVLNLRLGLSGFLLGQAVGLLNPELGSFSISVVVSSVSVLLIGLGILNTEIILPLRERTSQIEAMHNMSLAITSQLSAETVMIQIARQASDWLRADGVGIFLREGDRFRLAAVAGLPDRFVGLSMPLTVGVAGEVIRTNQSFHLINYATDWNGAQDFPLAKDTSGAVICVPLVSGDETIGALMVIASKHGRAFQADDVHLLQMIGAQAAVAITHAHLFSKQQQLTQEIDKARNQLRTVLTSTENPVVATNRELELIFANTAAERMFPALRFMAQPIVEVLPRDVFPDNYVSAYRNIRRQRAHIYELIHNERIYLCHLATLGDRQRVEGWVAVLNDITQLKELDRLKSEMVRMTSHDLKNPLQAAMANIDLLQDSLTLYPDSEVHESIQSIEKQLDRMYRIISGVLDMERIRTKSSAIQLCNPKQILQNVIQDFGEFASRKSVTISTQLEQEVPAFLCDPGQIERVISNLLENAIKFTESGGCVNLHVHSDLDNIFLTIQDTGIGIPEEDQPHIFDSFYRANQPGAEHISGTGLGLNLVKTIVERHGGQIWLESKVGHGTTFYVSLPILVDDMMLH